MEKDRRREMIKKGGWGVWEVRGVLGVCRRDRRRRGVSYRAFQ